MKSIRDAAKVEIADPELAKGDREVAVTLIGRAALVVPAWLDCGLRT